jgi:hypothetical protein
MPQQFKSMKASLPKEPGTYLVKIQIIREVEYVRLSDDNMDFDLPDDLPADAEVVGFTQTLNK